MWWMFVFLDCCRSIDICSAPQWWGKKMGTQSQCRSQNFHKSVIYLSHNCQKTVSCKNVSEKWHKTVRKLIEICQLQNSVRNLSDKIWKLVINVSEIIILSENCHCIFWKTVRKLSEILEMTDFWQMYGQFMNLSGQLKSYKLNMENWTKKKTIILT